MSLRARFILAFLLVVAVTLAAVLVVVRLSAEQQVALIRARGGWIGAEDLILDLQAYYEASGSWEGVEALLEAHNLAPGRQGAPAGQGAPGGQGRMPMGNRPGVRLADAQGVVIYDPQGAAGQALSPEMLAAGIRLEAGGAMAGYLLPLEGQQFAGSEFDAQLLQAVDRAVRYAALIAGGLALALALLLAHFLLRPVRQLSSAAVRMASGDLAQRVPARGGGELAALGQAFNHMAGSLQAAEARRRAMTADIAHELRTPLAVQRAHLEAMLDGVYPLERGNLEKVLEQNALLSRLVQDLRTLTLAEAGEITLEKTSVPLHTLVERAAARFEAQAGRKGVQITTQLPELLLFAQADPQRLEQILNNLLDNALRHTPEGGQVRIALRREGERTLLEVQDSGPGIPAEALPHLFERFYRADQGRARESGGSGLGLAIARQLAEAMGGGLEAANHPDGGAVFTLWLH